MPLYTKFGDAGKTQLYGAGTVSKSHPRVHAYGTVDELSSFLGAILTEGVSAELRGTLTMIQHVLYCLGGDLATPLSAHTNVQRINEEQVRELEQWIDAAEARVPPVHHFILPGGSRVGALLHHSRTVCRRAERWVVTLTEKEHVNMVCLRYLNRLGDFLFAAARVVNTEGGRPEERA